MSTNYYIKNTKPEFHIGKRRGSGNGKMGFTWAMRPQDLQFEINKRGFSNTDQSIYDEYGKEFSLVDFMDFVVKYECHEMCLKYEFC